jgi:hypothetical protein
MAKKQVVGGIYRYLKIFNPRGHNSIEMTKPCAAKWLIDGHPVFYSIRKVFSHLKGILCKPLSAISIIPTTPVLKILGKIPVIERWPRRYTSLKCAID